METALPASKGIEIGYKRINLRAWLGLSVPQNTALGKVDFNPSTADEELMHYMNLGSWLAGGSLIAFAILSFFLLGPSATLPSLLGVLGFASVIRLQDDGHHEPAKRVMLFVSNLTPFFNSLVYSTQSDYQFYLILSSFSPFFILSSVEFRERLCWSVFSFLLFVAAYPLDEFFWPAPSPQVTSLLAWIFRVSVFLTVLFWIVRLLGLKNSYIEALRRSKELLNKLENLSKVGGFEIDAKTHRIQPSSGIRSIFGFDFQGLALDRKLVERFIHPDDISVMSNFEALTDLQLPYIHEFRVIRLDGKLIHARICLDVEKDANGQTLRYIGAMQDISREKETEKLIREQQNHIASTAKFFAMASMAAGLAHEINNPLAIITGKLQQIDIKLRRKGSMAIGIEDDARIVQESANRMARIVSGLLGFAKNSEYDKRQSISAAELLDYSLEFCRERMRTHRIDLKLDFSCQGLLIHCRSVQIVQVLIHLIDNACDAMDAMPAGEPQWISVKSRPSAKEAYIHIAFSNSGPRIPESIHSKMMEPFFTSKDAGKGSGLGLSISRGIVEQHGGEFYFDHECSHTTFVMVLPVAQAN